MNIHTQKTLALALLDWHGGQSSALYAIGSCMLSDSEKWRTYSPVNHHGHLAAIGRAIRELRRLRQDANFPEVVSLKEEQVCNALADKLETFIPKCPVCGAPPFQCSHGDFENMEGDTEF